MLRRQRPACYVLPCLIKPRPTISGIASADWGKPGLACFAVPRQTSLYPALPSPASPNRTVPGPTVPRQASPALPCYTNTEHRHSRSGLVPTSPACLTLPSLASLYQATSCLALPRIAQPALPHHAKTRPRLIESCLACYAASAISGNSTATGSSITRSIASKTGDSSVSSLYLRCQNLNCRWASPSSSLRLDSSDKTSTV